MTATLVAEVTSPEMLVSFDSFALKYISSRKVRVAEASFVQVMGEVVLIHELRRRFRWVENRLGITYLTYTAENHVSSSSIIWKHHNVISSECAMIDPIHRVQGNARLCSTMQTFAAGGLDIELLTSVTGFRRHFGGG